MKKVLLFAAAGSAALLGHHATAAPFAAFDARSMAMGGAGVAVGNASAAPSLNPARLAAAGKDEDFALDFVLGGRLYDPDEFIDSVDRFQDDPSIFDGAGDFRLAASIDAFNTSRSQADAARVAADLSALDSGLQQVSDRTAQGDAGGGVIAAVPGRHSGLALSANGWAAVSAVFRYRDEPVLAELEAVADCYADGSLSAECSTLIAGSEYVDAGGGINFDPQRDLDSTVEVRGLYVREVALSFARAFGTGGDAFVLGLTPKYVTADVIDYVADAETAEGSDVRDSENIETYRHFNADIGLARDFHNGWRTGVVVKNVVAKEFETVRGRIIRMNPQARIGIARQTDWTTLALDVDLTENEPVNSEDKSRYVALGAEFNAMDWLQLRLGYRANTLDSARNVASAGIGLSPFGFHVDLAVAANGDELGASLQTGYRF